LHSKLELLSLDVKLKLAEVEVVVPDGPPVIEVSGGMVSAGGVGDSTVQLRVAGVESTFWEASIARTENWCDPVARLE
jgi:hypothetical protein